MGQNYYYLISSLPALNFDEFNAVPVKELLAEISDNVRPQDLKRMNYLRRARDLQNIRFHGEDWATLRELGNIAPEEFTNPEQEPELSEAWHTYMLSQKGEKPINIDALWLSYFAESNDLNSSFIDAWIHLDLALRTTLAVLRQEKQELSAEKTISEAVQQDEQPLVQEIIQNSRLSDFGISYHYDWAGTIRELYNEKNPLEFELALDRIRWDFLDQWSANRHFSSEVVLAYVIKLFICERWNRLDQQQADKIIQSILGGTSGE